MLAKLTGGTLGRLPATISRTTSAVSSASPAHTKLTSPAQLGRMKEEADAPVERVINPETGVEEEIEIIQPPAPVHSPPEQIDGPQRDRHEVREQGRQPVPPARLPERLLPHPHSAPTPWLGKSPNAPCGSSTSHACSRSRLRSGAEHAGDTKGLQALLNNAGIYAHTDQIKAIQVYMSAYLKHLAQERDGRRSTPGSAGSLAARTTWNASATSSRPAALQYGRHHRRLQPQPRRQEH